MKVNFRGLESFRETMLAGSVTAAAARLGLSQPAVSRLISQLEKEIGFGLFHRDRGRLVPTSEAVLLFDEVTIAFGNMERLHHLIGDIAQYNAGLLKVVAPPSVSEGMLPEILGRFLAVHPRVRVSIDSRSVDTVLSMVASRTADCGFAKLPIRRPEIAVERLSTNETVCVLREDHRLAQKQSISPEDLAGEPLILLGSGRWSRMRIDDAFASRGVLPNVRIETHTVGSACAFVARGHGITIVNELLARTQAKAGTVQRPFRPAILEDYAFITSSLTPMGRLASALLQEAKTYFAEAAVRDDRA